jgi:hypothetical protein
LKARTPFEKKIKIGLCLEILDANNGPTDLNGIDPLALSNFNALETDATTTVVVVFIVAVGQNS